MPRRIELWNQRLAVEKGQEPDPDSAPGTLRDNWTLVMIDRVTGSEHRLTVGREMRDWLVRELTGGIVLHGGEFPKI